MAQLIQGIYNDPDDAERAVAELGTLGYGPADISVLMSEETRKAFAAGDGPPELGRRVERGAGLGALIGGLAGGGAAGVALLAGIVVAGPIAVAAAAAAAGTGALVGMLANAGLPEDQGRSVEDALARGDIVVAVNADEARSAQVRAILTESIDPPRSVQ